ncbi:hypothetical protein HNR46_000111 [Haloferula luteola]|uniref:PA14 domain-containing protein n=1 Tax=Haloferula luteola TaxID=595692 RepID=A0A840V7F7_9BACT|nr:hypothetical protein [Haloferula luteola]MBB5349890.1 hypothetical protein [Haloferula luteola]
MSWSIAAVVAIVGALVIVLTPKPDNSKVRLPELQVPKLQKPDNSKKNKKPLPEELVEARLESSEMIVRKELRKRLDLFEEINREVASELVSHLEAVASRPLHEGITADPNDVSSAREIIDSRPPTLGDGPTVEDFYNQLAAYEDRILNSHLANLAAAKALKEGTSFPGVLESMQQIATRMPDYGSLVDEVKKQHGIDGKWLPPKGHRSTDDINRYRELLGQTSRQSGLAESRLLGLVSKVGRKPPPPVQARSKGPNGDGDGGMKVESAEIKKALYNLHEPKFESEELVAAQALPGRRFSRNSERRGWLYVNTWYMIGPWDSRGRNDFSLSHPPEQGVDLDAVYHDGQVGPGVAETDSHWLNVVGDEVELDGTLRWKFMQSEAMHNVMPVTTDRSTCYAYTELYFDEAETMLVAIGTDDSGKLWINGREIWNDAGASWYHIDEHLEPIAFLQGWNRVLIRIDNNGGSASGFSFLICPPDAPVRDGARAR